MRTSYQQKEWPFYTTNKKKWNADKPVKKTQSETTLECYEHFFFFAFFHFLRSLLGSRVGVWQWNPLERGYCSIKYIFEKTTTKYIFWAVTGFKIFETDARYRNAGWCRTAFIALQPWRKPKTKSIHNTCMHTTKTKPELDNKEQKGTHNQVSWEVKSKNKTNNRKYFFCPSFRERINESFKSSGKLRSFHDTGIVGGVWNCLIEPKRKNKNKSEV